MLTARYRELECDGAGIMSRFGIASVVTMAAAAAALLGAQTASAPKPDPKKFLTQPLITQIYTADPSAHVFNGKIYIYPSHDIDDAVTHTIGVTDLGRRVRWAREHAA